MNTIFITPVDTEDDGDVPKIKLDDVSCAAPFASNPLVGLHSAGQMSQICLYMFI